MKCAKCGRIVKESDKFCAGCGTKVIRIPSKVGVPYRINYSLMALTVWILDVWIIFFVFTSPDAQTRSLSFFPYGIFFFVLGLVLLATHWIMGRKNEYPYKGKVLSVIVLLLLIFTNLVGFMMLGRGVDFCTAYEHQYYSGCEQEKDYTCSHYSLMGLGHCDSCEKCIQMLGLAPG